MGRWAPPRAQWCCGPSCRSWAIGWASAGPSSPPGLTDAWNSQHCPRGSGPAPQGDGLSSKASLGCRGVEPDSSRGQNRVGSLQARLDPDASVFSHVALPTSGPSDPQSVVLSGRGGSGAPDDSPYPVRCPPCQHHRVICVRQSFGPGDVGLPTSLSTRPVPGPHCPQPGNAACSIPGVLRTRSSVPVRTWPWVAMTPALLGCEKGSPGQRPRDESEAGGMEPPSPPPPP